MKKLHTLCLLLLAFSTTLWGQRSDTIFQNLTSTPITTAPYTSINVNNIGQSQHFLYTKIGNNGAHTCITPNVNGWFQGSYDNSYFFQLTSQTLTNQAFSGSLSAQGTQFALYSVGLAPFVRVYINSFDTTNCTLSLAYGGSLYPVFASKLENTLLEGGYQIIQFNQSTAGSYAAIPSNGGSAIAVYGMWCSNATAQTITIGGMPNFLGTNDKLVLPPTGLPYYTTFIGSSFSINLGSSTQFTCNIQYRYEN